MSLEQLVKEYQVIAIICNQWGDTGKGKFVDYFAEHWADVIARGTGGNNAGHTVIINGKKRIFHLLPSGIIHEDKINVLGNGMVIDIGALGGELDELDHEGIKYHNLMVSEDAHVVMPYHIDKDKAKHSGQGNGGIGSTGRGIGPCYTDKIERSHGIMVRDLFNKDVLRRKLQKAKKEDFPDINIDDVISKLQPHADRIRPFVRDTVTEMHRFVKEGKKILLEGAQGVLLSVEYGTYPYVTSSDCSLNGTAAGVGIPASIVHALGIVKFPYMTRVGAGPFPTEFGGKESEEYCAKGIEHDIFFEAKKHLWMDLDLDTIRKLQKENDLAELAKYEKQVENYISSHHSKVRDLMNSIDPFLQGVGVRMAGGEYGATTKRPRRTGWTDLVSLKRAVGVNGPDLILTKADVLSGADDIQLCTHYTHSGRLMGGVYKRC